MTHTKYPIDTVNVSREFLIRIRDELSTLLSFNSSDDYLCISCKRSAHGDVIVHAKDCEASAIVRALNERL